MVKTDDAPFKNPDYYSGSTEPTDIRTPKVIEADNVNHPSHYKAYNGLEVIDLTEQMNFNRGNAVKYICRAGLKDEATEVQDLEKAKWYIEREIQRIKYPMGVFT